MGHNEDMTDWRRHYSREYELPHISQSVRNENRVYGQLFFEGPGFESP